MSTTSIGLDEALSRYLYESSAREPPVMARLRAETAKLGSIAGMQIAPEQAQFMALLARTIGAKRAIEVGTFTGYSAMAVALALPADGRLIACDLSAEWTGIARRFWAEAGIEDRIELRLGPGGDTLAALLAEGGRDRYDFAFIDADKTGYAGYYEQCLALVRPGGLILLDNFFRDGDVADEKVQDEGTIAIRKLTLAMRDDPRIDFAVVPIGDGLAVARRR